MFVKPHSFYLPFLKKEKLHQDTYAFYFDRTKESWDFLPGQYIQMVVPHKHADERGTMRYFTIASSPLEKKYLKIITKVIQSSFKKKIAALQKGDIVFFYGPSGEFYFQEKEQSHVFLAGGIGINPFISMFDYAVEKNSTTSLTLFASISHPLEITVLKNMTKIQKNKDMKIFYTLTQDHHDWTGERGRISPELIQKYVTNIQEPIYYIVGPPSMVETTYVMLTDLGVSEDRILQEHFSGY